MSFTIILTSFLLFISTSFLFSKTIAFSLSMIPIDSAHLPIMPQNFTIQQRHQFLMDISLSRASVYALERSTSLRANSLESPVLSTPSSYFVTQLSFGSRSHTFSPYVIIDTGSDITWVQCDGCKPCFKVKGETIRVQLSGTYKSLSLNDSLCQTKHKYGKLCGFNCKYWDGVKSVEGSMGTDKFIFMDSQNHKKIIFQKVAFGCGLKNNIAFGPSKGPENIISGVLGLSPGPVSFLTQLDAQIKGRFSYCLISWDDIMQAGYGKSTMYFGDAAQIQNPDVRHIFMNTDARKRYHVVFRGISVDGKRLPIDPSICSLDNQDYTKGFFVDSGAPYTILPQSAYQPLREALVTYFAKYKWTIIKESQNLCYTSTPKAGQSYPSVVFHFANKLGGEVSWVMNNDNIFVKIGETDGFCVAVLGDPNTKTCLFGAYQQANFVVLFDIKNSILSFAPKKCQEHRALGSSI